MKYIAYGSNMVREQMAVRCPDAVLLGTGRIRNARLEFYLHATVEKTDSGEDEVPVAVWEISGADERSLDLYEGYPDYYTRETWPVTLDDGTQTEGMIYLMKRIRNLPPQPQYYENIADAYRKLGLDDRIPEILRPALERSHARK